MSTKLNAGQLAEKRYPAETSWEPVRVTADAKSGAIMSLHIIRKDGYAAAIREVAQPIADQRDELLEALRESSVWVSEYVSQMSAYRISDDASECLDKMRAIIYKYPEP
jgi:hypothetical protein